MHRLFACCDNNIKNVLEEMVAGAQKGTDRC